MVIWKHLKDICRLLSGLCEEKRLLWRVIECSGGERRRAGEEEERERGKERRGRARGHRDY